MLKNPSFEEGWGDLPPAPGNLINQQPMEWRLIIVPQGDLLWNSGDRVRGVPECLHKRAQDLPEDEQPGQPGALILSGTHVYKVFHAGSSFGVELRQVITDLQPGTSCTFWAHILLDRHGNEDPFAAEAQVLIDGQGSWHSAQSLQHRVWNYLHKHAQVPPSGQITVAIRVKSKWDIPIDFFIDACGLAAISVSPPEQPPEYQVYDLARFVLPQKGRVVRLAYNIDGNQGRQLIQVQKHPDFEDVWLVVKDGQWERIYLAGDYICRDCDTSEAQDKFYRPVTGDQFGAVWSKRYLKVGGQTEQTNSVIHYWKDGCAERARGSLPGSVTLCSVAPHTFPSGITLEEVMTLQWHVGGELQETYRYAPDLGLVAWEGVGRGESSLLHILPATVPDLEPEIVGCIPPPLNLYNPGAAPPPPTGITKFSQRDPRWRDIKLGYSDSLTIGSAGCVLTCVAMLGAQLDPSITPATLNDRLKAIGGFINANIKWVKVPEAIPGLAYEGGFMWARAAADMRVIYEQLAQGPVIALVDFKPATTALDTHFVLAVAVQGQDLTIIDPWDGSQTRLLQRYAQDSWDLGRAIYGIQVYIPEGVEPPEVPVVRITAEGVVRIIVGGQEIARQEITI